MNYDVVAIQIHNYIAIQPDCLFNKNACTSNFEYLIQKLKIFLSTTVHSLDH